jgi:hypothetical protein
VIEKYFTVEEAELLIPKLEQIVESLMENKRNAMEIGQDLARIEEQLRSEEGHNVDPAEYMNKRTEMEFLVRIINEGLESIEDLEEVRLGDLIILKSSRQPLLDAARLFQAEGFSPDDRIVMRHAGADHDALSSTIGAAAKLTVEEDNVTRFRGWRGPET